MHDRRHILRRLLKFRKGEPTIRFTNCSHICEYLARIDFLSQLMQEWGERGL